MVSDGVDETLDSFQDLLAWFCAEKVLKTGSSENVARLLIAVVLLLLSISEACNIESAVISNAPGPERTNAETFQHQSSQHCLHPGR